MQDRLRNVAYDLYHKIAVYGNYNTGKEILLVKKPIYFKPSVADLKRLKGICESFDKIAHVACPADASDPVETKKALEEIQRILQIFGEEYGL